MQLIFLNITKNKMEELEITMADLKDVLRKADNLDQELWYLGRGTNIDKKILEKAVRGMYDVQEVIKKLIDKHK